MYVYISLPKSMLVYVCIWMYNPMHIYVHITVNMYEYACICVYARIYFQQSYIRWNWMWASQRHSHTGIMAKVITFHCGDWCLRPENAKGVLHHFEYLFASKFQELTSSDVLWFPCRALQERRNEKPLYTYIYIRIL